MLEAAGGSKKAGSNVQVRRTFDLSSQKWKLKHLGSGVYRITNASSGLALDVAGGSVANDANVQQSKKRSTDSQSWILGISEHGGLTFKNKKSGKYLTLAGGKAHDGANVKQAKGSGSKAQSWILRTGKGSLSTFAQRMEYYASSVSLGYDQSNRWDFRDGGECDCSSLVIHCLQEAGFETGSADDTHDMRRNLVPRGWKVLSPNLSQARPGDILLNDDYHTCAVISGTGLGALVAQASIDERGWIVGGTGGDQNGRETIVRGIYAYSYGWYCILRYTG